VAVESNVRIVSTPIAPAADPARLPVRPPRALDPRVLEAVLPGPGRDKLANGPVLAVTTGQQPGLFTGPLYTVYKALTAIALARRLERERATPVVPVFWVAGDDHDFAEGNHTWVLDPQAEPVEIRLRERAPDAPLTPLFRERGGPEITTALERLRSATPETEFKSAVLEWLSTAYRPDATLADAFAAALHAVLGARGLAVFAFHARPAKLAAARVILAGLSTTLDDGYTPVLVEASLGRDRLRAEGDGFVTRRSGERFARAALERIAETDPERLSPNVLLRPVVEAALLPTIAYAGGPTELEYLPRAAPLYATSPGIDRQEPVPRWSGMIVEPKVERLLERYGLKLEDLNGRSGDLESRLVRDAIPADVAARVTQLRATLAEQYDRLGEAIARIDSTLARPVQTARNNALVATQEIEKKLLASLKRDNETVLRQAARARATLFPTGEPQERVFTLASLLIRYGPGLLDAVDREVAHWSGVS